MSFSSTRRRTAGDSGCSRPDVAATGAVDACEAAAFSAAGAASCDGATFSAAPSSTRASSAPTSTVTPSLAMISDSVPATGEGTSKVTLSVSNSTMGSSCLTASPACFIQEAMVASLTDSPSVGTTISIAMVSTLLWCHFQIDSSVPDKQSGTGHRYSAAAALSAAFSPNAAATSPCCSAL